MTTFARITLPFQRELRNLPAGAERLYVWLLERCRAGKPQEVFLEEFAKFADYSARHVRRCLEDLMRAGLVEQVYRYAGMVRKLIAYDDRTYDLKTGQKKTLADFKKPASGIKMSETGHSNIEDSLPIHREDLSETTDITHHLHPVERNKPKIGSLVQMSPSEGSVSEPEAPQSEISACFLAELQDTLQQPLNQNIRAVLLEYPETRARDALDALREAMTKIHVKNPAGWFVQAVRKAYKPNSARRSQAMTFEPKLSQPELPDGFAIWFELALKAGVALASEQQGDEVIIHGKDCAEPFEQARHTWPLEILRAMVNKSPVVPSAHVKRPQPTIPTPPAAAIQNQELRRNALARLRAKFNGLPLWREQAIKEATLWGFQVNGDGIFDVAF